MGEVLRGTPREITKSSLKILEELSQKSLENPGRNCWKASTGCGNVEIPMKIQRKPEIVMEYEQ